MDLVRGSYELGLNAGTEAARLDILMGWGDDGQSRVWTIMDDSGRIHATVPRSLWPFPGKEVENLRDVLENACQRGIDRARRDATAVPGIR